VPTIDPTTVSPIELAVMLRAWAGGLHPCEAAVSLLVAHGHWLRRRDFLTQLVDAVDDGWGPRGTVVPMAAVDWAAVPGFLEQTPASSSEQGVLNFAASLAGTPVPGSVQQFTAGLDNTNGRHILEALGHRFGWHERGTTHLVTGHQTPGRGRRPAASVEPLPTFEDVRAQAYALLGDAADWLRSDYLAGSGPCPEAAGGVRQACVAIGAAKTALNEAASTQTRTLARRYADAATREARHG
jgi:hypothetical protein